MNEINCKRCLNIIVYYNNYIDVEAYICNLNRVANHRVDLIIVVNSDKEEKIRQQDWTNRFTNVDNIKIIDYKDNVGYLNAMLLTIKHMNLDKYDFVILSNTDIEYVTRDFYKILLGKYYEENIGCIAPNVYAVSTGTYSNPHYYERISEKKIRRNIFIFERPLLAQLYFQLASLKEKKNTTVKESCYVYSPHGCFMIFTRDFLKKIKGNMYGVKMYSEESYIGELLIENNMRCYYDSEIMVKHMEGAVTSKLQYRLKAKYFAESLKYIYETFYC